MYSRPEERNTSDRYTSLPGARVFHDALSVCVRAGGSSANLQYGLFDTKLARNNIRERVAGADEGTKGIYWRTEAPPKK